VEPPVPDVPELEDAPGAPDEPVGSPPRLQAVRVRPNTAAISMAWEFFSIVLITFLSLTFFIAKEDCLSDCNKFAWKSIRLWSSTSCAMTLASD
jgi:hypothetical protein